MDQPWNTRSGEQTEHRGPKGGEDLAELQRAQSGPKRDRASVQAQKQSADTKRRVHLEERARDQRIIEFMGSKKFLGLLAAVGVGLVLWLAVWPLISGLLNPTADLSDLRSTRPQIDLRASQVLHGDTRSKLVEGDSEWVLVYTLPRGGALYSGGRASITCSVSFQVGKEQPSKPQLQWSQVGPKHCI
jgi:hypothetical protein